MRLSLIIIFSVVLCSGFAQENKNFETIQKMLDKHFKQNPSENIYVQTDRDVYKAGDIVWFSAFVRNPSMSTLGSVSDNLVVSLFDETGELVNEDKYKLLGGICCGDFDLPDDASPGRYVLVAYSGATIEPNEVFMKLVYVDEFKSNSLLVKAEGDVETLVLGGRNKLQFGLTEMDGKPFSGKLNYELKYGEELIVKGKEKTSGTGLLQLEVEIPDKTFEQPLTLTLLDGNSVVFSSPYHVEREKLQVRFNVEGGKLLAGADQKIVFTIANRLGQAVSVQADLVERDSGRKLLQVKTMAPGYGIFPLTAQPGKKYQMRITDGPGRGQVFDLPDVESEGVAFAVNRLDKEFINCSLQLVGMSTKDLVLAAYSGNQLVWGTELKVEGELKLKIPKDGFPEGLFELMVFEHSLDVLASRLIYIEKDGNIQISADLAQSEIQPKTPNSLWLQLQNTEGQVQSGIANISVCPEVLISSANPSFEGWMQVNGWLETPLAGVDDLVKAGRLNELSVNYLLIGSSFKNSDWKTIQASQKLTAQAEGINRARLEKLLPAELDHFLQAHAFDQKPGFTAEFYNANPDLFKKIRTQRAGISKDDTYKQLLASGSSLLEVIKMIKPFTLDGDKIIFPGGTNSLLFQDGALIVIDGQKMGTSASVLATIPPNDVESIEISTRPIDIQQYTGLNSVGLIDIKTKKGERVVVTDNTPAKEYANGNRIPREFADTVGGSNASDHCTLWWEPFAAVDPVYEHELPGSSIVGKFKIRILAVDNAGEMGTKTFDLVVE